MRFAEVTLASPDPPRLLAFWRDLGFETRGESALVGRTRVRVLAREAPSGAVHLAFNVAEHRHEDARRWIEAHAPLIPGAEALAAPDWDAHMTYFRDPDGNVLELIARHRLPSQYDAAPFGPEGVEGVSEVGVVVADVRAAVARLCDALGERPWTTPTDTFATVGDEHGLLIVVPEGRPWFPAEKMRASPLAARLEDGRDVPLAP